jgi:osmotically-inducible protein OsmY
MKSTSLNTGRAVKALAFIICVGALPLVGVLTGCNTGNRYEQSTGEYIDDHNLSSSVKRALGADNLYKYGDVNVVTFKGVVQLNGFVNTKDQKSRAGDIASKVDGVKEVKNNVTVKE